MQILHKAIKPAGLVDGALTYSLFATESGLYAIKTGPAARELKEARVRGLLSEILAKFIFSKVEAGVAKKVASGEARLDQSNLDGHAREKGSAFFPRAAISEMSVSKNRFNYPVLTFFAEGKKWEFVFRSAALGEVEAFAKNLG